MEKGLVKLSFILEKLLHVDACGDERNFTVFKLILFFGQKRPGYEPQYTTPNQILEFYERKWPHEWKQMCRRSGQTYVFMISDAIICLIRVNRPKYIAYFYKCMSGRLLGFNILEVSYTGDIATGNGIQQTCARVHICWMFCIVVKTILLI